VIPDWFEPLRQTTIERLAIAVEGYERDLQQSAGIADNIAVAEQRLQHAQRIVAPFEQAITRTVDAHTAARDCRDTLADQLATAKRRDRPLLRSALAIANHDLADADTAKKTANDVAAPARRVVAETADALYKARDHQRNHRLLEQLSLHSQTIEHQTERLQALDTWQQWASGHTITPDQLEHAAHTLSADGRRNPQLRALRDTLPVQPEHPRPELGLELSID
jgi:hypothetical protein